MRELSRHHAPTDHAPSAKGLRDLVTLRSAEAIAIYVLLGTFCLFALVPLLWALSTSLKVGPDILRWPPVLVPKRITFEHYVSVFTVKGLPRFLLNSVVVGILAIALTLLVSCPLAYVTAHFEFRLKRRLLFLVLATIMVPSIAI